MTWVTTLRWPSELAQALETTARVDEVPISRALRNAVQAHVDARRADPVFQQRLKARLEADQRLMGEGGNEAQSNMRS